MQPRLRDSATEVSSGTHDIVVMYAGRRPRSVRARSAGPRVRSIGSYSKISNSSTASTRMTAGPDQALGRELRVRRHDRSDRSELPIRAAELAVRCQVRSRPAARGDLRNVSKSGDCARSQNAGKRTGSPADAPFRPARFLERCGAHRRVDPSDNTSTRNSPPRDIPAPRKQRGLRARAANIGIWCRKATVIPRGSMEERKSRRNQLDFFSAAMAAWVRVVRALPRPP